MLLGFGDGEIQHIDVRVTDRMYVLYIYHYYPSSLCLHSHQCVMHLFVGFTRYKTHMFKLLERLSITVESMFLTSGCPDFTLWRHNTTSGEARAWYGHPHILNILVTFRT